MNNNYMQAETEPPPGEEKLNSEPVPLLTVSNEKPFKNSEILPSDFSVIGESASVFRTKHFPEATDKQWNSWRWQIQNSYTQFSKLSRVVDISGIDDFEFLSKTRKLPLRITPYYASLLADKSNDSAIAKSVVPSKKELIISEGGRI